MTAQCIQLIECETFHITYDSTLTIQVLWICYTDIAECLIGNGGCAHDCTEFLGSYACSCKDGYRLKNDSHLCEGSSTFR